jgi:hypothetical protein
LTSDIQKRLLCMISEIQILAWERHKNVAVLNRLMGFPPFLITESLTILVHLNV